MNDETNKLSQLAQKIIRDNTKHRLSVSRKFSRHEQSMYANSEQAVESFRNKVVGDLAKHIIPKLELKSREDPFMDGGVSMYGQVYVFSLTEFEELVSEIESQVIKSLSTKFSWGDDT